MIVAVVVNGTRRYSRRSSHMPTVSNVVATTIITYDLQKLPPQQASVPPVAAAIASSAGNAKATAINLAAAGAVNQQ
jgi:hypothetical protein